MTKRLFITVLMLAAASFTAHAQFFLTGDEPTRVKWKTVETEHFEIIYPSGIDSVAREYGRELEVWRTPVGQSIHYLPGQYTRGKMPVILHPHNSYANGSVAWAPKRMDLYTIPNGYPFVPLSWDKMLAIHESRHVAQMQLGLSGSLRPFGWFLGEMFNGAINSAYGHGSWMEGDAVVTETALTASGRGRTADFLNYYRIAFDQGEMRDMQHWYRDSFIHYSPNKYALGYLMLSGFRYYYDDRDFMGNSWDHYSRKIYDLVNNYEIKKISGLPLGKAFKEVTAKIGETWTAEMDARAPFMTMEQITPIREHGYTRFSDLIISGNSLYAIRKSMYRSPHLVRIDTCGKVKHIRESASYMSNIKAVGDTLLWSETIAGPRWDLSNKSSLRYSDTRHKSRKSITRSGHIYNPAPSASGKFISAADYKVSGETYLVIFNKDFEAVDSFKAPDSLQIVESAWIGDERVFVTTISDSGSAIYELSRGELMEVIPASPVVISNLSATKDGRLMFTSDRTGEHELYMIDGDDVLQVTNTRYGAKFFQFSEDGKWLYFVGEQLAGNPVFRTPVDSLPVKKVNFSERYSYFLADNLSRQEKEYVYEKTDSVTFSSTKKYNKFVHVFNVHSWAPIYFNYDNIQNFSFDKVYESASLGTTFLLQNELGSTVFTGGYSAFKENGREGPWRHSGHAKLTYSGLYPVFEASLDINDRNALDYSPVIYNKDGEQVAASLKASYGNRCSIIGRVSAYIPLKWNKGGIFTGFIPKVSYTISNDMYDTGHVTWNKEVVSDPFTNNMLEGYYRGRRYPNQIIQASARGYMMTGAGENAAYPRWGVGFEGGIAQRVGLRTQYYTNDISKILYKPTAYAYIYSYLPGFIPSEGWRVTAKYQHSFSKDGLFWQGALNMLPRGMENNTELSRVACANEKDIYGFGVDYAIPFSISDIVLAYGLFTIKSLTVTPFIDMMFNSKGNLFSAGLAQTVDFSSVFWVNTKVSVGFKYAFNGGSAFEEYEKSGANIGHHFVGPVFSFDF